MRGLESENNPFRINDKYYEPLENKRSYSSKRNYPSLRVGSSPIIDVPQPKSIVKYVGQLQKTKQLNREFIHNDLYYPNPQKSKQRLPNVHSTLSDNKKSLRSLQDRLIQKERKNLMRHFRTKSQKKQQTYYNFHNNVQKRKTIMQKFHDDAHLHERSSPTFQNMLGKNLILEDILSKVKQNERKFIKGF